MTVTLFLMNAAAIKIQGDRLKLTWRYGLKIAALANYRHDFERIAIYLQLTF